MLSRQMLLHVDAFNSMPIVAQAAETEGGMTVLAIVLVVVALAAIIGLVLWLKGKGQDAETPRAEKRDYDESVIPSKDVLEDREEVEEAVEDYENMSLAEIKRAKRAKVVGKKRRETAAEATQKAKEERGETEEEAVEEKAVEEKAVEEKAAEEEAAEEEAAEEEAVEEEAAEEEAAEEEAAEEEATEEEAVEEEAAEEEAAEEEAAEEEAAEEEAAEEEAAEEEAAEKEAAEEEAAEEKAAEEEAAEEEAAEEEAVEEEKKAPSLGLPKPGKRKKKKKKGKSKLPRPKLKIGKKAEEEAAEEEEAVEEEAVEEEAVEEEAVEEEAVEEEAVEEEAVEEEAVEEEAVEEEAVEEEAVEEEAVEEEAVAGEDEPKSLERGLEKTRTGFIDRLGSLFRGETLDDEMVEEVEEILFTADIGVGVAQHILETVETELSADQKRDPVEIWGFIRDYCQGILSDHEADVDFDAANPFVLLVIGVNGVGKTTTIGKLASSLSAAGKSVMLVAGDTFRAGAVDQLEIWAERTGIPMHRGDEGADPSSVIYSGIERGQEEGADVIICDTAGRLHTDSNLLDELSKMERVAGKALEGAPHETMLVLDANTGQNAIRQAELFNDALDITGVTLTKLDGTAKGGVILGICDELQVPVRYIGIGEGIRDLRPFDAEEFVEALFM